MHDRLAPLLERFQLAASVFHSGSMCGISSFDQSQGVGHLHLLDHGVGFLDPLGHGQQQPLPSPALVLYAQPINHRLLVPEDQPATLLCATVRFGGGAGDPLSRSLPSPLIVDLAAEPALHKVARLLFEEAFAQHCGRQQALDRLAELLIIHVLRHVLDAGLVERGVFSGLADPQLAKTLIALHGQPAQPWTLKSMAARAGMSRARFAAHFHIVVGQTPADYLAGYRLALASAALRRGQSVAQVATEVGYGSASALARAFRTKLGQSPREVAAGQTSGRQR